MTVVPDRQRLRIATRGSRQALTQSEDVAARLRGANPGLEVELVVIQTLGDRTQRDNVPLHQIGGQGVFVKEVQEAVLDGRADLAVHSAKDLTTTPTEGLVLAAVTARRDPRDALVGARLADLLPGATVATGSVRRRSQLAGMRPDLQFVELRGNIGTRLERVPNGGAIVIAVAALEVLGLTDLVAEAFAVDTMVPQVGQGAVAVECRSDDALAKAACRAIEHGPTRGDVDVERAFLAEIGSGCSLPIGAHVTSGPAGPDGRDGRDGRRLLTYFDTPTGAHAGSTPLIGPDRHADLVVARTVARNLVGAPVR